MRARIDRGVGWAATRESNCPQMGVAHDACRWNQTRRVSRIGAGEELHRDGAAPGARRVRAASRCRGRGGRCRACDASCSWNGGGDGRCSTNAGERTERRGRDFRDTRVPRQLRYRSPRRSLSPTSYLPSPRTLVRHGRCRSAGDVRFGGQDHSTSPATAPASPVYARWQRALGTWQRENASLRR